MIEMEKTKIAIKRSRNSKEKKEEKLSEIERSRRHLFARYHLLISFYHFNISCSKERKKEFKEMKKGFDRQMDKKEKVGI